MATIDITIRGAGIFGLSIAWTCLKRGARVRVVDPGGVGAGASGGVVGALAPHTPERWNAKKALQLDSLLASERFWAEIDLASGRASGYRRAGRLQPLADDPAVALAEKRAEAARDLWQGHAIWRVVDAVPGARWTPVSATGLFVHDTLSASLHPRQACQSLAAAIVARGGEICASGADRGATVWATGWQGLQELSKATGTDAGDGVKGQALLLRHDAIGLPQIFADALHLVPHDDGTVAVGSTSERVFSNAHETDAQLDILHERAVRAVPAIADAEIVMRWAGVRPRARSRAPLLGCWPGRPGHFIANGGFKIGFGMAPAIAGLMADLILDGHNRIPKEFQIAMAPI